MKLIIALRFTVTCCAIGAVILSTPSHAQDWFSNATAESGLGGYIASTGDGHGPGGVFTDLNNDGYADLYLMGAWGQPNRLYINMDFGGIRGFVRAPRDAGAGDIRNATGAIAGDYDNDGDLDLYITNFDQPNALYHNLLIETGELFFVDVTPFTDPTPGIEDDQFGLGIAFFDNVALDNSLTAAWSDVDRDGDLDLYVGNHNGYIGDVPEGPFNIPGRRDVFYLNNGNGTFTDITMPTGVTGYEDANGNYENELQSFSSTNAVIFADFNNDQWPDLLVTNKVGGQTDRDMLYINLGSDSNGWLGYELVTWDLVPAFGNRSGAAMGVDVGDPDNDGDLDIYITDWSDLSNSNNPGTNDLWLNQLSNTGELSFIHLPSLPAKFSWGCQWQDFDNNGNQDLHVATEFPARDFLYMVFPSGVLELAADAGIDQQRNSRGDMTADYNRDGWVDMFVVNLDGGPSTLFRSELGDLSDAHFLNITLEGDPQRQGVLKSSRNAIGARVNVYADLDGDGNIGHGEVMTREVVSGSSNAASTSSLALEFGLGAADFAFVEVLWPSGRRAVFPIESNHFLNLNESDPLPAMLIDFEVVTGTHLFGNTDNLYSSDNEVLALRSGFGETFTDLHNMEIVIFAQSPVSDAQQIDLLVESRISEPVGVGQVSLYNWFEEKFQPVLGYVITFEDTVATIENLPAAPFINGQDEILVSIKNIVFVPFLAFQFDSALDQVAIIVE